MREKLHEHLFSVWLSSTSDLDVHQHHGRPGRQGKRQADVIAEEALAEPCDKLPSFPL